LFLSSSTKVKLSVQFFLNFPLQDGEPNGNQLTVEDYLAEGDTVVSRWTGRGTHTGDLMGIAPTGEQVTVTGISIQRIANGKIVEAWSTYDMLGMFQQLGVVPMPGQASS
jgi:predicted ester cyclase